MTELATTDIRLPLVRRMLGSSGVAIVVWVALILVMIVLPLPTLLIDALIVASFCAAAAVFTSAVSRIRAEPMQSLPTAILLTALFRLALTVAAGRAALVDGNAGWLVPGVGQLFIAGHAAIGAVVFLMVVLVQVVVVSRGSERVAELAARFALDAMPGQQLAIDADLRSGLIDAVQAEERRAALERRSEFYASMDGAMRFIQGEAVLIIVIVALLFGAGVGSRMLEGGVDTAEAAYTFGGLSIGIGLVTQLPAWLVAVGAALHVARRKSATPARSAHRLAPLPPLPVALEVGPELAATLGSASRFAARMRTVRQSVSEDLGVPLGGMAFHVSHEAIDPRGYRLRLHGHPVEAGRMEAVESAGEALLDRLRVALRRHAAELLGIEEVRDLLDATRRDQPTLIHAVFERGITLAALTDVLRSLLAENIPIRDRRQILESLAYDAHATDDPHARTERVRQSLKRTIAHRFAADGSRLHVFLVDDEIAQLVRTGLNSSADPTDVGVDPELADAIAAAARRCDAARPDDVPYAIFLTDADVRHALRALLAPDLPDAVVLSYRELASELQVQSIDRLTLVDESTAPTRTT